MPANSPGLRGAGSELTASDELGSTLEEATLGSELGADVSPEVEAAVSVDEATLEVLDDDDVAPVSDELGFTDEFEAALDVGLDVEGDVGGTLAGGGATLPVVEELIEVSLAGELLSPQAMSAATQNGTVTARQLTRDADMIPRTARFSNWVNPKPW